MSNPAIFPPYPDYQPVQSSWFELIPSHWKATALRGVLNLRNEKNDPIQTAQILSLSIAHGVTLYSDRGRGGNKRKNDLSAYKIAREGDIVLNSMNVIVGAVGLSRYTGAISPVYYALFPAIDEANVRYYDKVFSNVVFQRYLMIYGRGILIKESGSGKFNTIRMKISPNDLKGTLLPLPPRPEQDQIVAYLRAQDAHIARFIKAKRDLISLLTEQKQTIIERAVTQGLNGAKLKRDSGIDWIPHIPAHWETCKLKHVAVFNPSRSESVAHRLSDETVSFLPMECITTDGRLQNIEKKKTSEVWEGYTYFRRNDVVMAKITPCFENGKGGLLDALPTEIGFGTTEFIVLRAAARRIRPAFLAILLSLKTFRTLGADAMTGAAGQQRVPLDFVKNFGVALPPLDEQDQILRALETATTEQDAAIERIRSEIALIREYRDRHIFDVVTGQVDVRGWVPGQDDVVAEVDLAVLGDDEEIDTDGEEDDGDD